MEICSFHKYIIFYFVIFPNTNFLQQSKNSITFDFWSKTTSAETKLLLLKTSNHWNMEHYWVSADCAEVDLDSDLTLLASDNLRKYTNVPSQCESDYPRPESGVFCILIIDNILISAMLLFSMLRAINYH